MLGTLKSIIRRQFAMAMGRIRRFKRNSPNWQEDGRMHVVYALEASSAVLKAALVSMATLSINPRCCESLCLGWAGGETALVASKAGM